MLQPAPSGQRRDFPRASPSAELPSAFAGGKPIRTSAGPLSCSPRNEKAIQKTFLGGGLIHFLLFEKAECWNQGSPETRIAGCKSISLVGLGLMFKWFWGLQSSG